MGADGAVTPVSGSFDATFGSIVVTHVWGVPTVPNQTSQRLRATVTVTDGSREASTEVEFDVPVDAATDLAPRARRPDASDFSLDGRIRRG